MDPTFVIALLLLLVAGQALLWWWTVRRPAPRDEEGPRLLRDELRQAREEAARTARETREELLRLFGELGKQQQGRLDGVGKQLEAVRGVVDERLAALQQGNERKLDEMRRTVDEKLEGTLEKRLGMSFKLVSERLEAVQRGLGEMQELAQGVGDLKKTLANVKTSGTFGEIQLEALLEQILTREQYAPNVKTRQGSDDYVEFAVKLPGRDGVEDHVWLPIDAKFPQEEYGRLIDAADTADKAALAKARTALARQVRQEAKSIHDKYLDPPRTTDFAILFLPTEGLYAEVIREPGLIEELQREARVVVCGPTTLAATLSSLRMGFRTLAIEKRSSEVWKVLGAVKTEFGRFGEQLDKVKRHLDNASSGLEKTGVRTRQMQKKLRAVESAPIDDSGTLLELDDTPLLPFADGDGPEAEH